MNFNLLPPEYRKKPNILRRIVLVIISALLLWPIIEYGILRPVNAKSESQKQLSLLEEKTAGYNSLEEEEEYQLSQLEEMEQRMRNLQQMDECTPLYWYKILEILTQTLPSGCSLNHFTCNDNIILLSGTSKNDKISAVYLRNLQNSNFFSEVRTEKIVYQQNDEASFTLRCILKQKPKEEVTP